MDDARRNLSHLGQMWRIQGESHIKILDGTTWTADGVASPSWNGIATTWKSVRLLTYVLLLLQTVRMSSAETMCC